MKRRDFLIQLAGVPVLSSAMWTRASAAETVAESKVPRKFQRVEFTGEERELNAFLGRYTSKLHWFGAPVMAKVAGAAPRWINIVASFRDFSRVKRDLFELGVQPVSTPDMPASFIKFQHQGNVYNLVDCDLNTFCQSASMGARQGRLPFTHGLLVLECETFSLFDPCDAVTSAAVSPFRLLRPPSSHADAFDWLLAGWFETKFLGLPPGGDLKLLETLALEDNGRPACHEYVAERMINYFPDVVRHLGLEDAGRLAESPRVRSAMKHALGVEFRSVFAAYTATLEQRKEFAGGHEQFLKILHRETPGEQTATIADGRVARFMAQNNYAFRCPEWVNGPMGVALV